MPTFREKSPPCDGWYIVKWIDGEAPQAVYLAKDAEGWRWAWTETDSFQVRPMPDDEWRPIECAQCETTRRPFSDREQNMVAQALVLKSELKDAQEQCEAHSKTIDGLLAERNAMAAEVAALKKRLSESEENARAEAHRLSFYPCGD